MAWSSKNLSPERAKLCVSKGVFTEISKNQRSGKLPTYTDMVERPRSLEDTIADLMGGNLTAAAIKHAVAELKRLRDLRNGIEHLRVDRAVPSRELTTARIDIDRQIRGMLNHQIAKHIADGRLVSIRDAPDELTDGDLHKYRADAMVVPYALYECVVPPLPKTGP